MTKLKTFCAISVIFFLIPMFLVSIDGNDRYLSLFIAFEIIACTIVTMLPDDSKK